MSDPTLSDIDIKNKMALVWTTLKMHSNWLSENEGFRDHKHDGTKIKNDKVWKLLGRPRTRTVGMPITNENCDLSWKRIFMFLMILSSWFEFEVHAEFLDRELSWLFSTSNHKDTSKIIPIKGAQTNTEIELKSHLSF